MPGASPRLDAADARHEEAWGDVDEAPAVLRPACTRATVRALHRWLNAHRCDICCRVEDQALTCADATKVMAAAMALDPLGEVSTWRTLFLRRGDGAEPPPSLQLHFSGL